MTGINDLVRHTSQKVLADHPEITGSRIPDSISTKLVDPRFSAVELIDDSGWEPPGAGPQCEDPDADQELPPSAQKLLEILAGTLCRIDWEVTGVSDHKELQARIAESVVEVYLDNKDMFATGTHQAPECHVPRSIASGIPTGEGNSPQLAFQHFDERPEESRKSADELRESGEDDIREGTTDESDLMSTCFDDEDGSDDGDDEGTGDLIVADEG